jgi:hypothetical protein
LRGPPASAIIDGMTSSSGTPPLAALSCFTAGVALALVASGGVVAQRLSRGDVRAAVAAQALVTIAAILVFQAQIRRLVSELFSTRACLVAQVVGAACGIVIAHSALHATRYGALPWLSERPAQFVNDAVAVFAPMAVIWASARRPPSTMILAVTLGLVTAYRMTAFLWHLDDATFALPIQDLVAREFAGSALGITVFRALTT